MKILLDGDGCVFDMLSAVKRVNPLFRPGDVIDYDLKQGNYGITREEFLAIANSPASIAVQGLYPGAAEGVAGLLQIGDVVGWTGVSEQNRDGRRQQFAKLGVMNVDTDKQMHFDADVVIDDDVRQLMRFDWDVQKFLVTRRYNQHVDVPPFVIRVNDISEIVRQLMSYVR